MSSLFIYIFTCYFFLLILKTYRTLWRYAGVREILTVVNSLIIANLLYLIYFLFFLNTQWPFTLMFFLCPCSILVISGFRVFLITKHQWRSVRNHSHKRALIIGAGVAGTRVVNQIISTKELDYTPVGFIDDDPKKQNLQILGIPVLGERADIKNVVNHNKITDIIIAMPSVHQSEIREIVNVCKKTKANVRILPPIEKVIKGQISFHETRDINLKDLIGREIIQPTERLKEYLFNKCVLITGAGGSIGSELAMQVAQCEPKSLTLLGHGENSIFNIGLRIKEKFPHIKTNLVITDIQDQHLIEQAFRKYRPHIVFHAAAHKHVPLMELNERAAVQNNIFGTKIVAQASDEFGVERFVLISTDKAVHPVNIMGMTKRIGEMIIQYYSKESSTKFSIVRFGNVLESRGSVIPIFKHQIESGGPVTITHPDMVRYFMTIPEAVQLVLEAGALSEGGEVFVLDMGKPVKIEDLAKNLIRLYGYEPDVDIPIQYTGIRPGEKLNETLFYENEKIKPTPHPNIVIAIPSNEQVSHLLMNIEQLERTLLQSSGSIRPILTEILQNQLEF
ncbi:polysaccharide biosynthesis protein [Peribacillus asahii]|uniref:polysaccharide biosynthesis protein n=1 Tax=Peribacillus asahii TaxID=228899 RepID=UPI00207A378E|nr:nucleoside-diphosphate sugar epimerase/dehydratase [Peribacillus asahii]USK70535.1 polysaccharide biosynthesis protein [Peribacillus asahii]